MASSLDFISIVFFAEYFQKAWLCLLKSDLDTKSSTIQTNFIFLLCAVE